jgi:hypothetical protein
VGRYTRAIGETSGSSGDGAAAAASALKLATPSMRVVAIRVPRIAIRVLRMD